MAEEDTIVSLDEIPDDEIDNDINLALLVGKVLSNRSYNFEALKRTLT